MASSARVRRRLEAAPYGGEMSNEELEAIQAVVDRVTSWQDGATEGTVDTELREGFAKAGVNVTDEDVRRLADAIESEHGAVSAVDVLS
ncbi:MAG: hypothetical protein JWN22_1377 [Nocardioides sp.]|nr:hypothetical protein [Nocardioides sp.]